MPERALRRRGGQRTHRGGGPVQVARRRTDRGAGGVMAVRCYACFGVGSINMDRLPARRSASRTQRPGRQLHPRPSETRLRFHDVHRQSPYSDGSTGVRSDVRPEEVEYERRLAASAHMCNTLPDSGAGEAQLPLRLPTTERSTDEARAKAPLVCLVVPLAVTQRVERRRRPPATNEWSCTATAATWQDERWNGRTAPAGGMWRTGPSTRRSRSCPPTARTWCTTMSTATSRGRPRPARASTSSGRGISRSSRPEHEAVERPAHRSCDGRLGGARHRSRGVLLRRFRTRRSSPPTTSTTAS